MSTPKPVALILGAGSNIGDNVAREFANREYSVARVARRLQDDFTTNPEDISIYGDLSQPDTVAGIFDKVKAQLGVPTVVVYNAYAVADNGGRGPLGLSLADFIRSLTVNTTSVYAAIQKAVKEWGALPGSASPVFIYTGNGFVEKPIPSVMDLSVGKAASASLIELLVSEYKGKGYKFYFADERMPDGDFAWFCQDGPAHAKLYVELAGASEQRPWNQTFVKGKGYTFF